MGGGRGAADPRDAPLPTPTGPGHAVGGWGSSGRASRARDSAASTPGWAPGARLPGAGVGAHSAAPAGKRRGARGRVDPAPPARSSPGRPRSREPGSLGPPPRSPWDAPPAEGLPQAPGESGGGGGCILSAPLQLLTRQCPEGAPVEIPGGLEREAAAELTPPSPTCGAWPPYTRPQGLSPLFSRNGEWILSSLPKALTIWKSLCPSKVSAFCSSSL